MRRQSPAPAGRAYWVVVTRPEPAASLPPVKRNVQADLAGRALPRMMPDAIGPGPKRRGRGDQREPMGWYSRGLSPT